MRATSGRRRLCGRAGTVPAVTRRGEPAGQADLFSTAPAVTLPHRLNTKLWPGRDRFPFNRAGESVRSTVWDDLVTSTRPLVVAGYSSIAQLVDLAGDWTVTHPHDEDSDGAAVRVLVGAEPFGTGRVSWAAPKAVFTDEVRRYWLEERGISVELSAKVLQAIDAVDTGRLVARCLPGPSGLHAKVFAGDRAVTVGSSNFTTPGLTSQIEANVRFHTDTEPVRYRESVQVAENLWALGEDWTSELRALLEALLRVTGWEETLARACAELLEGDWAARYLDGLSDPATGGLWPSQRAGIAQALWVISQVGSVLVADATGSGKTRMGAHLVRAIRDRVWATGRVRGDLTVLVCPPAVEDIWAREALRGGLSINTVSHGLLSRTNTGDGERVEVGEVRAAQILAVDEAHNFLAQSSARTRQIRDSNAEHVALFTATPINRGASDLLALVSLLGPDNFDDRTLDILRGLERSRAVDRVLTPDQVEAVRSEIQRFTVRRTKTMLNELVDADPDAYRHPDTGRICRYPDHDAHPYPTGETSDDETLAEQIRDVAGQLTGLALLERRINVPAVLRRHYSDQRWWELRAAAIAGLAGHHVLGAMRSSRAALVEHLEGTATAAYRFGIGDFKTTATGNVIDKLDTIATGPPPTVDLDVSVVPDWLIDGEAWAEACRAEADRYRTMARHAAGLSDARELAKARLLVDLAGRHDRVLAFDHHLITLAALAKALDDQAVEVVMATGSRRRERDRVEAVFARHSTTRAIALCSDAMNEGINLQGASTIVHLDLPTTLRVAEQRVGRVDRMDSPHDRIEAWWPDDGPAFATRANEHLAQRAQESTVLLGANLIIPDEITRRDELVPVEAIIAQTETADATWDGIRDALEPVRHLVSGLNPLIPPDIYHQHRHDPTHIGCRISVVDSPTRWAFIAVAGANHGAPRWIYLPDTGTPVTDLAHIATQLRSHLRTQPATTRLQPASTAWLSTVLERATRTEPDLLPRRHRRALTQLATVTSAWASRAAAAGDETTAGRWRTISRLAGPHTDTRPDPYNVADIWLRLVTPTLETHRAEQRRSRYTLLDDITPRLTNNPFDLTTTETALGALPAIAPLPERVRACILGHPTSPPPIVSQARVRAQHGSR